MAAAAGTVADAAPQQDVPTIKIVGLRNRDLRDTGESEPAVRKHVVPAPMQFEAATLSRPHVRAERYAYSELFPLFIGMTLVAHALLHGWSFYPIEALVDTVEGCSPVDPSDSSWLTTNVRSSGWAMPVNNIVRISDVGDDPYSFNGSAPIGFSVFAAPGYAGVTSSCALELSDTDMATLFPDAAGRSDRPAPDLSSAVLAVCLGAEARKEANGSVTFDVDALLVPRSAYAIVHSEDGVKSLLWPPQVRANARERQLGIPFPGSPNVGRYRTTLFGAGTDRRPIPTLLQAALSCLCKPLVEVSSPDYNVSLATRYGIRWSVALVSTERLIELPSGDFDSMPAFNGTSFTVHRIPTARITYCQPVPAASGSKWSKVEAVVWAMWVFAFLVSVGLMLDVGFTLRRVSRHRVSSWIDGNIWVAFIIAAQFLVSSMPPILYFGVRAMVYAKEEPPPFTSGEAWVSAMWAMHLPRFYTFAFRALCVFFVLSLGKLPMVTSMGLSSNASAPRRCLATACSLLTDLSALRFPHHAIALFYLFESVLLEIVIVALSLRLTPFAWNGAGGINVPTQIPDDGGGDGNAGSGFWISAALPVFSGPLATNPARWFGFDARTTVSNDERERGALSGHFTDVGLPILIAAQFLCQLRCIVYRIVIGLLKRYGRIRAATRELVIGHGPASGHVPAVPGGDLEAIFSPPERSVSDGMLRANDSAQTLEMTTPSSRPIHSTPVTNRFTPHQAGLSGHPSPPAARPSTLPVYQGLVCRYTVDGHRYATQRVVTWVLLPILIVDFVAEIARTWFTPFTANGPSSRSEASIIFPQMNMYPSPALVLLNVLRTLIVWYFLLPQAAPSRFAFSADASGTGPAAAADGMIPLRTAADLNKAVVTQFTNPLDPNARSPLEASIVKTLSTAATLVQELRLSSTVQHLVPVTFLSPARSHVGGVGAAVDLSLSTTRTAVERLAFVSESGWTLTGTYETHDGLWLSGFLVGATSVEHSVKPSPTAQQNAETVALQRQGFSQQTPTAAAAGAPLAPKPAQQESPLVTPLAANQQPATDLTGTLSDSPLRGSNPRASLSDTPVDSKETPAFSPPPPLRVDAPARKPVALKFVVITRHRDPQAIARTAATPFHAGGAFTPHAGPEPLIDEDTPGAGRLLYGEHAALRALLQDLLRVAHEEFEMPFADCPTRASQETRTPDSSPRVHVAGGVDMFGVDLADEPANAVALSQERAAPIQRLNSTLTSISRAQIRPSASSGAANAAQQPYSMHDICESAAMALRVACVHEDDDAELRDDDCAPILIDSVTTFDVAHAAARPFRRTLTVENARRRLLNACFASPCPSSFPKTLPHHIALRRFDVNALCPHGPKPFQWHPHRVVPLSVDGKDPAGTVRVWLDVPPTPVSASRRHTLHPRGVVVEPTDAALRYIKHLASWIEPVPNAPVDLPASLASQK
jgi:hypothetical protein